MGKQPSVLINILNYSTYDMTLALIESIHKNLSYDNYTIFVVDNCSPNESAKILEKYNTEGKYLFFANKVNSGYAAGNNIGIRYAIQNGYDYTLILNSDIELCDNNFLLSMINIAEGDPSIACVGPRIFSLDGTLCVPYCRRPTFWNMTLGLLAEKRFASKNKDISQIVYRVYGCCMLLRSSAMNDVDCMDERTFLYCEEDILAERLQAKGYKTYYDAETSITHLESGSIKKNSADKIKTQIKVSAKSREIYLRDYRNFNWIERRIIDVVRYIVSYMKG